MSFRLSPIRSGGEGSDPEDFPFKIYLSGNKAEGFKRGVSFSSTLLNGRRFGGDDTDEVTITGLLTEDNPADDDSGWAFTIQNFQDNDDNQDRIWLEIKFDATTKNWPNILSASIKSDQVQGASTWNGGELEYVSVPPSSSGGSATFIQQFARIIIGVISYNSGSVSFSVDQNVRNNLKLLFSIDTAYDSAASNGLTMNVKYFDPI